MQLKVPGGPSTQLSVSSTYSTSEGRISVTITLVAVIPHWLLVTVME